MSPVFDKDTAGSFPTLAYDLSLMVSNVTFLFVIKENLTNKQSGMQLHVCV